MDPLPASPVFYQPLGDLFDDPIIWARNGFEPDRVALFMDLLGAGDDAVPPIEVIELPDGRHIPADGRTRIEAARRLGLSALRAVLLPVPGGVDPADFAYDRSLETAIASSKPLTRAERQRAARQLLERHAEWPDREIARRVGLSHQTVGRLRDALAGGPVDQPTTALPADEEYLADLSAGELSKRLVSGVARLWDAQGFTDMAMRRLPRTLGEALVARFGPEDALTWARRIERWASDAANQLETH